MISRTSLTVLALAILAPSAWSQVALKEILQARKDNNITAVLNATNLRDWSGTGVFELRAVVKGFISSRGDTLMLETADGLKLNIRSTNTPEFLKHTSSLARLIVKLSRNTTGSDFDGELVMAAEDGPIADYDAQQAAAQEAKDNKSRPRQANSRSGGRGVRGDGSPTGFVTLEGPIGGDPTRDQRVLDPQTGGVSPVISPTMTPTGPAVAQPMTVDMAYVVGAYANYMVTDNHTITRTTAEEWARAIIQYSAEVGLDPRLMIALVTAESDFKWRETSNKGAMGLAQLMPDEVERFGVTNAYDPAQNIRAACHLLREGIDKYKALGFGDWESMTLALAGYNAGHGAVKKYGYRIPPYKETQDYVSKITRLYKEFTGAN